MTRARDGSGRRILWLVLGLLLSLGIVAYWLSRERD